MKKLIFAMPIAAFLFVFVPVSARAGQAGCGDNVRCLAVHNPQTAKPAVSDEDCIYFIQPYAGNAVLTFTFPDGSVRVYSKNAGPQGVFCVARRWVRESVWADLCNQFTGSADYFGIDLRRLAQKPQFSRAHTACLYGTQECERMGYKVWR